MILDHFQARVFLVNIMLLTSAIAMPANVRWSKMHQDDNHGKTLALNYDLVKANSEHKELLQLQPLKRTKRKPKTVCWHFFFFCIILFIVFTGNRGTNKFAT